MMRAAYLTLLVVLSTLLFALHGGEAQAAGPARRLAIVVGANEPAPGRDPLRYSHADASMIAGTLVQVGHFAQSDVRVLLEPRPDDVLAALDAAARTLQATPGESLLVFYYSGHSDGQHLYPHGERLALATLRDRLEKSPARVKIAIVDACRGGSWTRAKGLSVGPPIDELELMNVATEGMALLSSSSGVESAHEAGSIRGSFFTHHLNAGLLGAADTSGDSNVTLQEAFVYARERTIRDSARLAATTQHPSFDMQLRGRQDIVLAQTRSSRSALDLTQKNALEIIHLGSGSTITETTPGVARLHIALSPGKYVVRRVENGRVLSKEITIGPDATVALDEAQLAPGGEQLAAKSTGEATPAPSGSPCIQIIVDGAMPPPCKKNKPDPWEKTTVGGLRGSFTHVGGSDREGNYGALLLSFASEQYKTEGILSGRLSGAGGLGGGTGGFEGGIGGSLAGGVRLPVGADHGPVARIGLGGELMGNKNLYFSRIQLPTLEVGYQYIHDRTVLEAGMRGSVVLTGRYYTGNDTKRDFGDASLEWGAYLAAHTRYGRIDAQFYRIEGRGTDPSGPINIARGWLCGYVIDKVGICADAMVLDGDAMRVGPGGSTKTRVASFYGGLMVGVLTF